MTEAPLNHPVDETLLALSLGQLAESDLASVSAHLSACPACCRRIDQLAADDRLLAQLRQSVSSHDETPVTAAQRRQAVRALRHLKGAGASTRKRDAEAVAVNPPPRQIGDYDILGEIGRGGMGVVYKARHRGLRRLAALKMVLAGEFASSDQEKRFRLEAEAIARLSHPNIVQVYEIGSCEGRPFLALEYIGGGTLAGQLEGRPQPARVAAQLVRTLAQAIEHAHERGIVHRDLKPANILLAAGSEGWRVDGNDTWVSSSLHPAPATLHLKITDFGLARLLDDRHERSRHTRAGDVLGTPAYMAPEQARGDNARVGPATDIYALGAILYELLTGRRPFETGSWVDVLNQIQTDDPIPPRRLNPGLNADLDTIVLKCLEKDARQRYVSAAALADDLGRFLAGEPIRARPVGPLERGWRWAKRRPAIASLLALVALLTVTSFLLVSWQLYETDKARNLADRSAADERSARLAEEAARHRAQALSAGLALDQGMGLCKEGKIGPGLLWMVRALELLPPGEDDLDFAIRANLVAWKGHFSRARCTPFLGSAVPSVAFSPDGKSVLVGTWGNAWAKPGPSEAQLYDPAIWKPRLASPVRHTAAVWSAAFSPGGQVFATGSFDGTARQWHTADGQPAGAPMRHGGRVYSVAYRPDGAVLATVARIYSPTNSLIGSEVCLWDAATSQPRRAPIILTEVAARCLAWSPDGSTLAIGGDLPASRGVSGVGGVVRLLDPETGQERGTPLQHAESVNGVAFHPRGDDLATASEDGVARFWDVHTHVRRPAVFRHPYPLTSLTYCREGVVLATAGGNTFSRELGQGEVRIWDVATGQELMQPLVHYTHMNTSKVHAVAISPDRSQVVTASENGQAWLWPIAGLRVPLGTAKVEGVHQTGLSFAPEGGMLLASTRSSGDDNNQPSHVHLWKTSPTFTRGPVLTLPTINGPAPTFSPDGRTILTVSNPASREHRLRLWNTSTGQARAVPPAMAEGVTCAAWGNDGTLLVGGADGNARLWDSTTFVPKGVPLSHGGSLKFVAIAPDQANALTAGTDGKARLWALPGAKRLAELPAPPERFALRQLGFTAGGRIVVTQWTIDNEGDRRTYINRWNLDGKNLGTLQIGIGNGIGQVCAWHPAGNSFLTTEHNGFGLPMATRLWDSLSGQALGLPVPFPVSYSAGAFHPSGRFLALGDYHNKARLWSVMAGKPIGPPVPHPGGMLEVAFSPDGRMLATLGADMTIRLWNVTGAVGGSLAEVRSLVELLTGQYLRDDEPTNLSPELQEEHRKRLESSGLDWPS